MPPNNTPVYNLLGLPLLNTFLTFQWLHSESAKRDLNRFSSPKLGGQGSLENYLGFVWGGGGNNDNTCIVISIGTQCCIGVAVLVNNCFFW